MLSDSPPDRDVIWTEEGVAGAYRFVQRIWRLVGEWAEQKATPANARRQRREPRGAGAAQGRASRARRRRGRHQGPPLQRRRREDLRAGQRHRRRHRACRARTPCLAPGHRRGARIAGPDDGADDAASGRGMLGDARPRAAWSPPGPGRKSTGICWSRTPSPAGPDQRKEARRIDNRHRRVPS